MNRCRYPHCMCIGSCVYGGATPTTDPRKPKFDRADLRALAERFDLAGGLDGAGPGFHLDTEDMKKIAFALSFTAEKL